MIDIEKINNQFQELGPMFLEEIKTFGIIKHFEEKSEILQQGQIVKQLPFLIKGLIRIHANYDGKEMLYYYIKPTESCIMSFNTIYGSSESKIIATAVEACEVLFVPIEKVKEWIVKYPLINTFFYKEYESRYRRIVEALQEAVFLKLDQRIMNYLKQEKNIKNTKYIKLSHKEIANNMGTAREVVCRILKKLEKEGKIIQNINGLEVL